MKIQIIIIDRKVKVIKQNIAGWCQETLHLKQTFLLMILIVMVPFKIFSNLTPKWKISSIFCGLFRKSQLYELTSNSKIVKKHYWNSLHVVPVRLPHPVRCRSQTTLTRFWLFLTTYPPPLTFSTLWTLTKIQHFWTTYSPSLVNIVCERPP